MELIYPALLGLCILIGLLVSLPLVAILTAFFHVSHSQESLRAWQALSSSSDQTDEFFQSAEYLAFLKELGSVQPTFLGTLSVFAESLLELFWSVLRSRQLQQWNQRLFRLLCRLRLLWLWKVGRSCFYFFLPNTEVSPSEARTN